MDNYKQDNEEEDKLKESCFFVNATHFERMHLYNFYAGREYNFEFDAVGFWRRVGYIMNNKHYPVCVSFSFIKIDGRQICFYETTSRYTDYFLVEEYIKENYPVKYGRRVAMTNASNFHHVLNAIRDREI